MPRPKSIVEKVKVDVWLTRDLLSELDFWLLDPFTGKRRYGARQSLITSLLEQWVRRQKEAGKP
jgi:hypothetical protein